MTPQRTTAAPGGYGFVYFEDDPKPVMAAVLLIHERRPVAQLSLQAEEDAKIV
jgi:hypothetical protein